MKISGSGEIKKPADLKKIKRASSADAAAFASMLDSAADSAAAGAVEHVALQPNILAVQNVAYDSASRRQQLKRGDDMLKYLDEIRMGLLSGGIAKGRLQELKNIVSAASGSFDDPKLQELIEEIETRAAVELAKLDINM